jgi:hypothetical protein
MRYGKRVSMNSNNLGVLNAFNPEPFRIQELQLKKAYDIKSEEDLSKELEGEKTSFIVKASGFYVPLS